MLGASDRSAIFSPVVPNQAVATLLLIENSQEMVAIWPDLRDHHLPTLIGTMRIANPVAPIKILMLTSSPVDEHTSPPSAPREYYELPQVQFHFHPDNRLSISTINRGIDLLASTGLGEPTARHIVIVAASTPVEDMIPEMTDVTLNARSGWHVLAHKLSQQGIHCHMILNPNQNMNAFTELFYETLRLQNFQEVAPWFQTDENYLFHLSSAPINHVSGLTSGSQVPCTSSFAGIHPSSFPPNYAFPSDFHPVNSDDLHGSLAVTADSQVDVSQPSLVARLQQAHGLTKKKIYGVKPNRQPFFRDERVREKYRRAPTSLTISPSLTSPGSLVYREGPSSSRSRHDHRRLNDSSQVIASNPHPKTSPLPPWPRRFSSPETDASLPSPTTASTYNTISPVLPCYSDLDQFSPTLTSPVTPSADDNYTQDPCLQSIRMSPYRPMDPGVRMIEPTWLENQYPTSGAPPPLSPTSQIPLSFHTDGEINEMSSIAPKRQSLPLPLPPPPLSASLPTYKTPLIPGPPIGLNPSTMSHGASSSGTFIEPMPPFSLPHLTDTSLDALDKPFIFNDEYEDDMERSMDDDDVVVGPPPISPVAPAPLPASFRYTLPPPSSPIDRIVGGAPPASLPNPPAPPYPPLTLTTRPLLPPLPLPLPATAPLASPTAAASPMRLAYARDIPYPLPRPNVMTTALHDSSQRPSSHDNVSPGYAIGGSSSLTGWAG